MRRHTDKMVLIAVSLLLVASSTVYGQTLTANQRLLREVYQELIEINTTNSVGDTTRAAAAVRTAGGQLT